MGLTTDAIIFGLGFLNGPKAKLSFGGAGAEYEITPRARAALDCLIDHGYAVAVQNTTGIDGREIYVGTVALGPVAKEAGIYPFSAQVDWPCFVKKDRQP